MVEVHMLDWLQGHVHAHIHIDIQLPSTLGALLVHVVDLRPTGADHVQVQIIGVPPPQREVQFPDVRVVPAQSVLQLLLDYDVLRSRSCHILRPTSRYIPRPCPRHCSWGRDSHRNGGNRNRNRGNSWAGPSWSSSLGSLLGCCLLDHFLLFPHFSLGLNSPGPEPAVDSSHIILALVDGLLDGGGPDKLGLA